MAIERINDRYDVIKKLGNGGMGDVWLAQDDLLGRMVAVKFVGERELRETPGAEQILRDEAKNAGRLLGHPNVVAVLDLIDVETTLHKGPAVILEFVNGCNVGEWIGTYAPRLDDFTRFHTGLFIATAMVEAVSAAHKVGILHRDVKPTNVLVSGSGLVKVADFGLSRVVEEITRSHTVWGRHTPLYAAPEQWEGEKPDELSDRYQVCATIYHLLAGVPANEGANMMGLLRWHQNGTLTPIGKRLPAIGNELAERIDAGLSKDPGERTSLWRIFDALSEASLKEPVRLHVDVTGLDEDNIARVAQITDFTQETLLENHEYNWTFPHPLEAVQEAIGTTVEGAAVRLFLPSEAPEAPPDDAKEPNGQADA